MGCDAPLSAIEPKTLGAMVNVCCNNFEKLLNINEATTSMILKTTKNKISKGLYVCMPKQVNEYDGSSQWTIKNRKTMELTHLIEKFENKTGANQSLEW